MNAVLLSLVLLFTVSFAEQNSIVLQYTGVETEHKHSNSIEK